jgi:hypothetical protein
VYLTAPELGYVLQFSNAQDNSLALPINPQPAGLRVETIMGVIFSLLTLYKAISA